MELEAEVVVVMADKVDKVLMVVQVLAFHLPR